MSISLEIWPSQSLLSRIVSNSFYSTTTFLTFTVEIHSNNLTHHQKYSKKQQMIYQLIKYLHDVEGLGYRKISQKLNSWGIPTHRGKEWLNTSVHSVLKRKKQREDRIEHQRLQKFDTHISEFQLKYITFD
jgi:hypothetical protein